MSTPEFESIEMITLKAQLQEARETNLCLLNEVRVWEQQAIRRERDYQKLNHELHEARREKDCAIASEQAMAASFNEGCIRVAMLESQIQTMYNQIAKLPRTEADAMFNELYAEGQKHDDQFDYHRFMEICGRLQTHFAVTQQELQAAIAAKGQP